MRLRTKSLLWLLAAWMLVVGAAGVVALGLWADLDAAERAAVAALLGQPQRIGLLLLAALALPLLLWAGLRPFIAAYPARALKLAEQLQVIAGPHRGLRIEAGGATEMARLATEINAFADAAATLGEGVEARVAAANARLEREKNRLAALMSELAQAVLVCNPQGQVLLYNDAASRLLTGGSGLPLGLGRSLLAILDRRPVEHAMAELQRRLERGGEPPVVRFVTARAGHLLRAQAAPVLDPAGGLDGIVLVLEDITRTVERHSRLDRLLLQLTEGSRASVANIRAAAETVAQFPDMDSRQRERFHAVIRDEAEGLSRRIDEALVRGPEPAASPWPLEDVLAADLLEALRRNLAASLGLNARIEGDAEPAWLEADSHALVRALTDLADRIAAVRDLTAPVLEATRIGHFVRLMLRWPGPALDDHQIEEWTQQAFDAAAPVPGRRLKDVLEQHRAELWCQADRRAGVSRLCLQLPALLREAAAPVAAPASGRPVYYDFDLFDRPGQPTALDQRPLAALAYTVFDTETTGLDPSGGDEIISIGAVRIVNGRLLRHECFDQLVDPRRAISAEARRVHGIDDAMLAGQPPIDQVLPAFHAFAEDSVLVAHNAAFDLRFLQLKEAATGVRFEQPVLDTLLLSAVAHAGHADAEHRLEAIAARLGVPVVGRHSALGDAIVAAEVLLKLLPLLAAQGIRTLGDARAASQRTAYAKLSY
ncbi:3'-5' exonuclease [Aquabacterium humicola]|uniref:3'-5' exonuclease n=1 Tax=Aquabacterium humicola TaxID=3237377 RepID=UPI002543393A|nr:exonuclease domain-containing protein [Rubrivivax pictus]